jgi:hypothetical protein
LLADVALWAVVTGGVVGAACLTVGLSSLMAAMTTKATMASTAPTPAPASTKIQVRRRWGGLGPSGGDPGGGW